MSTTYSIHCLECKVSYWCGQSNYLYRGDDDFMMKFLQDHIGHKLLFTNDLSDAHDDIVEEFKNVDKQYYTW